MRRMWRRIERGAGGMLSRERRGRRRDGGIAESRSRKRRAAGAYDGWMIAIISLLTVLVVSLLVVRVASVALTLTGLSEQLARFQARSAFTGAGFTTNESEKVVHHPVRRRIIMTLMLLGNAGIVTAISSLILSFVGSTETAAWYETTWFRMSALVVGLTALWYIGHSAWIDRWMRGVITRALKRWTDLEVRDYAGLLHLGGGYTVIELTVEDQDWMAQRELAERQLSDEGVLVLGIQRRDGTYDGAPRGKAKLLPGDTVLMYGRREVLRNLDERRADMMGEWSHQKAVLEQEETEAEAEAKQAELADAQEQETELVDERHR